MIWLSIYLICAALAAIRYTYYTIKDDKKFLKEYHVVGILVVIAMGLIFPAVEIFARVHARKEIEKRREQWREQK